MKFFVLITDMKTVIVRKATVVGICHYMSSELEVEKGYEVKMEPEYVYHSKALKFVAGNQAAQWDISLAKWQMCCST